MLFRAIATAALLLAPDTLSVAGPTPPPSEWTYVPAATPLPTLPALAPVAREFRGAWVASVANIDWPSEPGLPTDRQQLELLAILDRAVALRLNAVILQVRPAGDALYPSPYEPWSEYLTGEMGKAPEPFWDPLAFAVAEAHRRGLELHAWFNPYRARHVGARSPVAPQHISRTHPQFVKKYGGYLWMDPGEREVQDRSVQVILDVVRRYDVDAVHIDDYFYPYRVEKPGGGYVQFPDDESWTRYRATGGTLARDDWRRRNVDQLVERLYREVKKEKAWVKFGISPFGIWRPGHPASVRGLDAYQELYADSRKWVQNGWLDYVAPQLYWPTSAPNQRYGELLRWWVEQNAHNRHIWPGNFTSRVGDARQPKWTPGELLAQVRITRAEEGASGNIHFSMTALLEDQGRIVEPLREQAYTEDALVPASPWLARGPAPRAQATASATTATPAGGVQLALATAGDQPVRSWVVRTRHGSEWRVRLVPGVQQSYVVEPGPRGELPDQVAISAVDRVGREGPAQLLDRKRRW